MSSILLRIILIACFFFACKAADAQVSEGVLSENYFFQAVRSAQDESYITFGQGIGNLDALIFEAFVTPNFLLRTSTDSRWGAVLTPAVLLRMKAEESFPVQTPGYKPQLTFYHQIGTYNYSRYRINFLFVKLAHHSNGQEEPFYLINGEVNLKSGNFSTNFIEIGAFFNKKLNLKGLKGSAFRSSLEIHPDLDRSPELNGKYSFFRWHNQFRIFFLSRDEEFAAVNSNPRFQTTMRTSWLFGNMDEHGFFDAGSRLVLSVTGEYRPEFLKDVSLFVNFYSGEDYYNIHFGKKIVALRFGLQAYSL